MPTLYVKHVVEPADQELASAATPEPIHNTDIIEIDESITISGECCCNDSCYLSYVQILNLQFSQMCDLVLLRLLCFSQQTVPYLGLKFRSQIEISFTTAIG